MTDAESSRQRRAGSFHSRPQDRRSRCRDRRRRRSAAKPSREKFRQLCRLLGAIYHYEYFDRLEKLRNDYFYFSPELDAAHARFDAATLDRAYGELIATLRGVLHNANFVEIPHDEINRAHREHALVQVDVEAPRDDYREVLFFRRGHHQRNHRDSRMVRLAQAHVEIDVYDDVVLLVAIRTRRAPSAEKRHTRHVKVRPGAVLLKYFRDIARTDLNALFPDVRVVMGLQRPALCSACRR